MSTAVEGDSYRPATPISEAAHPPRAPESAKAGIGLRYAVI
jgi:hypothetical protein